MAATTATVTYKFASYRSAETDGFCAAFRKPPRTGAVGDPYHLEQAHLDIIENLNPGARVLEIGCGGAQMRSFLAQRNIDYVGTDITKTRVPAHLQRHGGPDIVCDAHFLPFVSESFDLVYSSAVTEHLACPVLAMQHVYRVLRPGGYYLGNVSFLEPWHDSSFFHMTPLGVFETLTEAGLTPEYIWPGHNYSGFRAIMAMANRATAKVAFLGDMMYAGYNLTNSMRKRDDALEKAARVAGATDWIARKAY